MKKTSAKISAALLSVIVTFSFLLMSGCGDFFRISVTGVGFRDGGKDVGGISMTLGEKRDVGKMVTVTPGIATDKEFTLASDNASVIKINGESAEAVGIGNAVITATTSDGGKTASLFVAVTYAPVSGVTIEAEGDYTVARGAVILGRADIGKAVEFSASVNDYTDPELTVNWSVSGGEKTELALGDKFTFTPADVGKYEISALVSDGNETVVDAMEVYVFDTVENARVEYSGSLDQKSEHTSTVRFSLVCDALPEGNPEPIVQWLVNGEEAGAGKEFSFVPSAPGLHEVEGRINGVTVDTVSVRVSGTVVPQNVYVDFDNCYPEIWVRWDNVPAKVDYALSIVDKSTGREVSADVNSRNNAIADKFTSSGFEASAYITDIFNKSYEVKVKTLGDGGLLSESDWSNTFTLNTVPARAESYLTSRFYDGARNRYITSYDEFYEWYEYAMLWRPKSVQSGEKLYLAYNFTSASDVMESAMKAQHFTGMYRYSGIESTRHRRECTFTVEFETDGTPSRKTEALKRTESWNAMRPHVNYDSSLARPSRYEFPIDKLMPVSVSTSEQLYYMAQRGYRPVPVSGSTAERLYNYARKTLRYIITEDMTDLDKIHAIYDWIMWRNIYDYQVLVYTDTAVAVKYESYYLESIFADTNNYGVCDAMSKAFSLMCAVEGIECLRVTGKAGTGGSYGGHAWNKVKLYGSWYIVDCTWGDVSVRILPDTNADSRESASHTYFLLSDADVKNTHVEDADMDFPATAKERYPWYKEDIGGIDLYLDGNMTVSALEKEVNAIFSYYIEKLEAEGKTYRVGGDEANVVSSGYYGFEMVSAQKWGSGDRSQLVAAIKKAITSHGLKLNDNCFVVPDDMGSTVHSLIYLK